MERIPLPPYPNGWISLGYADELGPGEVKPVHALGRDFVVFRGEDGRPRVLDAYCVHLGAHLGIGGKVEGNGIRCPFHAWCYDGDTGKCTDIPYAKRIPPSARVKPYRVREQSGFILIWHHDRDAEPDYEPDHIPELDEPNFRLWGKREWRIRSHPQEIMENGVDFAHFPALHGWKLKSIDWQPNGPFYSLKLHVDDTAADQAATAKNATNVDSYNSGPGYTFTRVTGAFRAIAVNVLTPTDPERLWIQHAYFYDERSDRGLVDAFFENYIRDYELDVPIWDNKLFRARPTLAAGDGRFAEYRKWYRQFYSEDVPGQDLDEAVGQ